MKLVIQRSKTASVTVAGTITGQIEKGLVVFVGITHDDDEKDVRHLAEKLIHLRIFEDEQGKMNRSLVQIEGQVLSVSQFTLYADCRKGRRPNFMQADIPDQARRLYEQFNVTLREKGIDVQTGLFGEMMDVELVNDGPVTLIMDSKE